MPEPTDRAAPSAAERHLVRREQKASGIFVPHNKVIPGKIGPHPLIANGRPVCGQRRAYQLGVMGEFGANDPTADRVQMADPDQLVNVLGSPSAGEVSAILYVS